MTSRRSRALRATSLDDAPAVEAAFAGASAYISDYSFELSTRSRMPRRTVARGRAARRRAGGDRRSSSSSRTARWMVGADQLATLTVDTTIGDSVRVGGVLVAVADRSRCCRPSTRSLRRLPDCSSARRRPSSPTRAPLSVTVDADDLAGGDDSRPGAARRVRRRVRAARRRRARELRAARAVGGRPRGADVDRVPHRRATPSSPCRRDGTTFAATDGEIVATATGTTRDGAAGDLHLPRRRLGAARRRDLHRRRDGARGPLSRR